MRGGREGVVPGATGPQKDPIPNDQASIAIAVPLRVRLPDGKDYQRNVTRQTWQTISGTVDWSQRKSCVNQLLVCPHVVDGELFSLCHVTEQDEDESQDGWVMMATSQLKRIIP